MKPPLMGAHGPLTKMSGISSKWRFTRGNVGPQQLIPSPSPHYFLLDDTLLLRADSYEALLRDDQMLATLRRHSSVRVFLANTQPQIAEMGEQEFDFRDTATLRIHPEVKLSLLFRIVGVSEPSFWGRSRRWKFRFVVVAGVVNRRFQWELDGDHGVRPLYEQFVRQSASEWGVVKRDQYVTDEDEERESQESDAAVSS